MLLSIAPAAAGLVFWALFSVLRSPYLHADKAPDNLATVPRDNPKLYEHVEVAEDWKNPLLQVHGELVSIKAAGEETRIPASEVLSALRALPASEWPYGLVVGLDLGAEPSAPGAVQVEALLRANGIEIIYWP